MLGLGVKTGDRLTIYLPMLACARIGAIHSVVFGGFSSDSLANRIQGCASNLLITADEARRGAHPKVAEAAVVGFPHDIKGQGIYAYVPGRGAERGAGSLGAEGSRADCVSGCDPLGTGAAEDPERQDHAANPAQDRGR
jgi:acyl-coenzyme A synthetase/AMP-(fatty) acid ligase